MINGVLMSMLAQGTTMMLRTYMPGNAMTDLVQAHPVNAVLSAGWTLASDALSYDDMPENRQIKAEGNVKQTTDNVVGTLGLGMGERTITGIGTFGLQLAKDLVDDGKISNLEAESEAKQGMSVAKNIMNAFPATAPFSSVVSSAQEIQKIQKQVEE